MQNIEDLQETLRQQKKRKAKCKELKDYSGAKYWANYIRQTKDLLRKY